MTESLSSMMPLKLVSEAVTEPKTDSLRSLLQTCS